MFISPHIRIRISYASPHLFSASPLCKKFKPEGIWSLTPIRNLTTEFGPATCPDNQCWSLVEAPILRYIRIYGFPCILSIHPDISNFNDASNCRGPYRLMRSRCLGCLESFTRLYIVDKTNNTLLVLDHYLIYIWRHCYHMFNGLLFCSSWPTVSYIAIDVAGNTLSRRV